MKISIMILMLVSLIACELNSGDEKFESRNGESVVSSQIKKDTLSDLRSLKSFISTRPMEAGMFKDSIINGRLKKLLGEDYADFMENWNRETPLINVEDVLHTSGCQNRNCAFNEYDLFIDLNNNKINVYHLKYGKEIVYKEGDKRIQLPRTLQSEIRQRQNKQKPFYHPPHLQNKTETTQ